MHFYILYTYVYFRCILVYICISKCQNVKMSINIFFKKTFYKFSYILVCYIFVVSEVNFRTATKHLRLSFYRNRQRILPV